VQHKLNFYLWVCRADESFSTVNSYPLPVPFPSEEKKETNVERRPQSKLHRPSLPLNLKEEPNYPDRTSQSNYISLLLVTPSEPSLLRIVYNLIYPKVVFLPLDVSKCECKIESASTRSKNDHDHFCAERNQRCLSSSRRSYPEMTPPPVPPQPQNCSGKEFSRKSKHCRLVCEGTSKESWRPILCRPCCWLSGWPKWRHLKRWTSFHSQSTS